MSVDTAMQWLMFIAALGAALTAIFVIGRKIITMSRGVIAVHAIIQRELTTNGGASMKDQLNLAAVRAAEAATHADDAVEQTRQTRSLLTETIVAMERIDRRVLAMAADQQEIAANSDREHADLWATLGEAGFDRRRRPTDAIPSDDVDEDGAV